MNAINVPKMKNNFFSTIGVCIIDECHLIMAESLSKSLLTICPRYLIGLSATPYREDGLNKLLDFYFGSIKIIRELFRKHIVYKVSSGLDIPIETSENGRVNWNAVLKIQTESIVRNELIITIIKKFADKNFLVLSKRVEQATFLYNRLKEEGEYVTSLIGKQQTFDKEARILVGIITKCGTGFDHPKLNALILASDLDSYFIQALGRIFRVKDTLPIVFDIIDNNFILQKHYKNRLEIYKNAGGKIINFEIE
jgi:superfamily II DNA or RNA helicase